MYWNNNVVCTLSLFSSLILTSPSRASLLTFLELLYVWQYSEHGAGGSILVLQTCLDYINDYGNNLKNMPLHPVYTSIFKYFMNKPNFSTVFCESLKNSAINEESLQSLSDALHLSASEKIGLGLALSDSENLHIRMCGKNFCVGEIAELCASPTVLDSTELIQDILIFLNQSEGLSKHVDSFMQMLSLFRLKEEAQFILAPFYSDESPATNFFRHFDCINEDSQDDFDAILAQMEKESNMADLMKELGYGCTYDVSQCKEILSLFLPLSEVDIARILGTVARTYADLYNNQSVFTTFCSALGSNIVNDMPPLNSWNVDILVDSIKQLAPGISWINVMENLDYEGFYIPDEAAFSVFMSSYRYACKDPFPLHAVCGSVWKNIEGQISFLKYAALASPEVFTFAHSERQLASASVIGDKKHPGCLNHAWVCYQLLKVLCQLAERGHASFVLSILETPINYCPEVLLLGLAHVNTAYNLLQYEVWSIVFPMVLKSDLSNNMMLQLWQVNPNMLVRGFIKAVNFDPDNINIVLDACQELKILSPVLDMIPTHFGVRLAALSSRKALMDLEQWLIANLSTYKDSFYEECLKFVKEVQVGAQVVSTNHFQLPNAIMNIYLETCSAFFKVLQSHANIVSSRLSGEMEKLHVDYLQIIVKHKNSKGVHLTTSDVFADDIEAESCSYFRQMFSGQLTVDTMIQILCRLKESQETREQSIFKCMITNLLEEYNFFYKYPEEQLKSAAALFGLVIKHRLVTQAALGIALWGVLDALRKPADSKMFVFGTEALEQFLDCLIEWPQYCNFVLQISHLHPKLVEPVKHALSHISSVHAELDIGHNHDRSQASTTIVEMPSMSIGQGGISHSGLRGPPTFQVPQRQVMSLEEKKISTAVSTYMKQASHPAGEPLPVISSDMAGIQKPHSAVNASLAHSSTLGLARSSRSTSTKFGSALNIGTLVAAAERRKTPIEAPASEIQDKISFIFNNLSPDNLEAKAKEFSEILKEQYYAWFAQYLVMKRASIEYNFHELYLKFLDKVNLKPLNNEIVQASYENCKVLLGSELIKSSSEERSLLKNLGSWLGKITIGKNQVLRAREIDPKALIIEAYEKGLMIAVVPFTSKILDSCSISLAYQPPNPWTMAILGLLSEIYVMPNLKMNIKFEIEVLFKNLNVDLKDVTPTSLLKDRIREVEGNPDFSNNVGLSHPQMVNEARSGIIATLNQLDLPLDVTNSHPTGHSRVLSQCASPLYLASGTLTPDEKLPPAQGVLQGQSKYSVNQLFTPASNIEQQVVVNPKLHTQGLYLHFQRVLPTTMDRAIKDIVYSIVQCSVSIAAQTTKELVLKDYVMEPDETRICNAAHLMVAGLAGSLAHVTCKEHLRASLSSYLRNTLQGISTPSELEQAIQLVINDNLDLGCALIERAATEKAIQTIDGEIAKQLSIRRKHREGVGPMHFDSLYAQGLMGLLPEALRPLPGRLSHSQQRVYEDFVQLRGQNPSSQSSVAVPLAHSTSSSSANLSGEGASVSRQINSEMHVSGTIIPRIGVGSQTLGISSKEKDTDAAQLTSVSTRTTTGDVFSSQNLDKSTVTSYSPIGTPQLHAGEASDSVKESRAAAQPPNPTSASETVSNISEPCLTTGDALKKYRTISEKLENLLNGNAKKQKVEEVIAEVPAVIIRCLSRDEAALAVAQKAFKGLYENGSSSVHVDAHLAILATMRDVSKLVVKELTSWVIYSDEDRKFNKDITVGLIHSELLNLAEYNVHMAKLLDAGRNKAATEFSISLIQTLVMDDSKVISELHNLVDVLAKLAARPGSPESLQRLVEIAKNPAANSVSLSGLSSEKDDNTVSSREKDSEVSGVSQEDDTAGETEEPDSVALREQVSVLFVEWYKICERPRRNDEACSSNFLEGGLLKGDNTSDYFFHLMDISVAHCLRSEVISSGTSQPDQGQPLSFLAIDIYAKLVCAILRFCSKDDGYFKLNLLTKVLAVTVKFIQEDADKKRTSFNPRPYFRIFINWILDFSLLDPVSDGNNFQALTALANAFHALQPLKCPGFSFAWLELISHRGFMPKLLIANAQKGWPYFRRLLVDLFQFMEPFLTNPELGVPVQLLYKGTLRVVLVLLHDFPEFLCYNHFSFCDVIPPSCIQLRSVILSAYPRSMKIPDPNRPDLKLDLMTEMSQPPCILSEIDAALKAKQIKAELDHYLRTRQQRSLFLSELKQKLVLSPSDAAAHSGTRYDVPLINSLVLYVGMESIQLRGPVSYQQWQYISRMDVFLGSAALNIFKSMLTDLDSEGRYLFLNAVANQLRYPNTHTFYFSFLLLSLFAETNQETIQEQITRVLVERRMANRPCPWGLEVTFMELIKNPQYNFWSRSFIRCAPEIEAFFESIFRSSGVPKPIEENVVSSGSAV